MAMPNFGKGKGSMMPDMPTGGSKKLSAPPPSMGENEPDDDEGGDSCECPACGSKLKIVAAGGAMSEPDDEPQASYGKGGM